MKRLGSFRIGVTALVAIGFLAVSVTANPATGAAGDPSLQELWEQFPLNAERAAPDKPDGSSEGARRMSPDLRNAERDVPMGRERSVVDTGTKEEPARRSAPDAVSQPRDADWIFGTSVPFAIVAAAIVLLLAGFAVITGDVPRVRMPKAPFARWRRLAQVAPVPAADRVQDTRATLTTRPSAASSFPAPSLIASPVEELLRIAVAASAQPEPGEANMFRRRDRSIHAPESEALTTQAHVADSPKQLTAWPRAEAESLKRKQPANGAEALKANGENAGVLNKDRLVPGDAVTVKEKLAAIQARKQAAKARLQDATKQAADVADALKAKGESAGTLDKERLIPSDTAALKKKPAIQAPKQAVDTRRHAARTRPPTRRTRRLSALRNVPDDSQTGARSSRMTGENLQECEIQWWRGYVRSMFLAIATRADGTDVGVASSRPFSWRKGEPPLATSTTAEALRMLVESLEHKGWKVVGRGSDWFAVKLARGG